MYTSNRGVRVEHFFGSGNVKIFFGRVPEGVRVPEYSRLVERFQ